MGIKGNGPLKIINNGPEPAWCRTKFFCGANHGAADLFQHFRVCRPDHPKGMPGRVGVQDLPGQVFIPGHVSVLGSYYSRTP